MYYFIIVCETRMKNKKIASFGSWTSPIKAESIAAGCVRLGQIEIDGDRVYWLENRPSEEGRNVIVTRNSKGKTLDVIPFSYNARTRVHEYGGGSFAVKDKVLCFSNFKDQNVYIKIPGENIKPLTRNDNSRYADFCIDLERKRVLCVREKSSYYNKEPDNSIISVSFESLNDEKKLISGNDFYSSPRLSPDGRKIAYLIWDHPRMPWDGTELWVADLNPDGSVSRKEKIAGSIKESIFQPEWSPDNILYFISDRNNWWNIYRFNKNKIESLIKMEADFGLPQWVFGLSTYDFYSCDKIVCSYIEKGKWYLGLLDLETKDLESIKTKYDNLSYIKVMGKNLFMKAASPIESPSIVKLNINTGESQILRHSTDNSISHEYISVPEPVSFPSEKGEKVYGFYYYPKNKKFRAKKGEKPPLIVMVHGGPTSSTSTSLDLKKQFWTSRGFAVFDVNYGGSSGYGRSYRERLKGTWGVKDVDDCINGANFLIKKGKADKERLIIRGGSAGGYTVLCALTFRDFFKAGASYYGVSDLIKLTEETHKFESHYLDSLIGKYPEEIRLYEERSPIHFAEKLNVPVIFFQGAEDKVVLPEQSESFVSVLKEKDIPVSYILFDKEQHGFRRAKNIKRSLEAELYFYSRVFAFELSEEIEGVLIENLYK
jgi:dipeptidyl aminopeptidase/acylaminoacyl peptidase